MRLYQSGGIIPQATSSKIIHCGISRVFSNTVNIMYMQLTCNCHTFWDESTSQLRRLATICTLKIDGAPLGTRGVSAMSFLSRVQNIRNHLSHTYKDCIKWVNHVNAIKCHKPSPSHHHFYGWDSNHQEMVVVHGIGFPTLLPMKTRASCARVYVSGKPLKPIRNHAQ